MQAKVMRILYHYWLIPVCRKARIMLGEKKLEYNSEIIKPWDLSDKYLKMNPSGYLPTLIDKGVTEAICGTHNICEYLEEAYPEQPMLGKDLTQRTEVRRVVDWFDEKFNKEVSEKLIFEKYLKRHFGQGYADTAALREGVKTINDHLCYIEWLLEDRNWLAGDYFSLADISAAAHLSAIDYLGDVPWDRYFEAKEWYMRVKCRPSFRGVLNESVPGLTPPKHYSQFDF